MKRDRKVEEQEQQMGKKREGEGREETGREEPDWPPGSGHLWTEWDLHLESDQAPEVISCGYQFQDGGGPESRARADLNTEQRACIGRLHKLFPRGFVFCTPACEDRSSPSEEPRQHIAFSHVNLEHMWDALYDYFEPPPEDSQDGLSAEPPGARASEVQS